MVAISHSSWLRSLLVCLFILWGGAVSAVAASRSKMLVVYFSWGGNTEYVAQLIGEALPASVLKVDPKDPYPHNYPETLLRVRAEKKTIYEEGAYPPIKTKVERLGDYGIIIICYPLWLGKVAMPMQSFLHSHGAELDGKVIVPICTSGKSAGRKTLSDVLRLCPQSHVATLMCIKRDEMPRAVEIVEGWVPYIRSLSRVED